MNQITHIAKLELIQIAKKKKRKEYKSLAAVSAAVWFFKQALIQIANPSLVQYLSTPDTRMSSFHFCLFHIN